MIVATIKLIMRYAIYKHGANRLVDLLKGTLVKDDLQSERAMLMGAFGLLQPSEVFVLLEGTGPYEENTGALILASSSRSTLRRFPTCDAKFPSTTLTGCSLPTCQRTWQRSTVRQDSQRMARFRRRCYNHSRQSKRLESQATKASPIRLH